MAFIGQTGSGKTTLARELLNTRGYVVVLDSKGTLDWPGYQLTHHLNDAVALAVPRIIYRPVYAELMDPATIDAFFEWIYKRRNTTAYVDEVSDVTQGDVFPFHFGADLRKGRELGVEMWCATQRPTRIPQVVLSESEHVYCFRLRLPQDRARVEATAAIDQWSIAKLAKRQFLYSAQDGDVSGPYTLTL